jgi:hypothetical protein
MKKLIFILSLCELLGINAIAQKGQTSKVISSYHFRTDWSDNPVKCKHILKVNMVENDTHNFVSIQFEDYRGGNGYVYCSNKSELNTFINDLTEATLKINEDSFLVSKPKYKITVEKQHYRASKKMFQKIVIYEIENPKSYMILNMDEVNGMLRYLKSVKL